MRFMRSLQTFLNLALLLTLCGSCFGAGFNTQSVGVLAALTQRQAGSSLVSSNNYTSYLKFEDDLADSYGDAWSDNNTVTWNSGKIGQALQTTRENDPDPAKYISHGDNSRFNLEATDFTIAFWVNNSDVAVDSWLVQKTSPPTTGFYIVQIASGGVRFVVCDGAEHTVESGSTSSSTWYFVVAQRTVSSGQIRIRTGTGSTLGSWTTTGTSGFDANADAITIGASYNADSALTGMIDGFQITKRLLSEDDITKLFNSGNKARPQLP